MRSMRRNNNNRSKMGSSRFPKPYAANPRYTRKFRFESTAAEQKEACDIYVNSIFNLMFTCRTTTTGTIAIAAFRVLNIEIFGYSTSTATSFETCGVTFAGKQESNVSISDSGNHTSPPHVSVKPPKNSFAASWWNYEDWAANKAASSTPHLFSLELSAGSVVDLVLEYQLYDAPSALVDNQLTLTGAPTIARLYFNQYLDNTSSTLTAGTQVLAIQNVTAFNPAFG